METGSWKPKMVDNKTKLPYLGIVSDFTARLKAQWLGKLLRGGGTTIFGVNADGEKVFVNVSYVRRTDKSPRNILAYK